MHRWIPAVVALVTWALAGPALAAQGDYYHGPGMMWGGGAFGMLFGFLMMLLFVGGIVVLVVLAFRWLGASAAGGGQPTPGAKSALDILKERLARGEIDVAEYQERRRVLGE